MFSSVCGVRASLHSVPKKMHGNFSLWTGLQGAILNIWGKSVMTSYGNYI